MEDAVIFYLHWSILQPFGIFYGHLVYFVVIWYIFTVLGCCTKKNLATLHTCIGTQVTLVYIAIT
jgi:hypothetical protein